MEWQPCLTDGCTGGFSYDPAAVEEGSTDRCRGGCGAGHLWALDQGEWLLHPDPLPFVEDV